MGRSANKGCDRCADSAKMPSRQFLSFEQSLWLQHWTSCSLCVPLNVKTLDNYFHGELAMCVVGVALRQKGAEAMWRATKRSTFAQEHISQFLRMDSGAKCDTSASVTFCNIV